MNEWLILAYTAAPTIGFIVLLFLWNLWLAPYRLMREHLEAILEAIENGKNIREGQAAPDVKQATPSKANISDWTNVELLSLNDAACLWVGLEPHSPIATPNGRAVFSQLKGAIKAGSLQCNWPSALEFLSGQKWPQADQVISMVELAKYAVNQKLPIPEFLRNVKFPPQEPKKNPAAITAGKGNTASERYTQKDADET